MCLYMYMCTSVRGNWPLWFTTVSRGLPWSPAVSRGLPILPKVERHPAAVAPDSPLEWYSSHQTGAGAGG